eukprot:381664-Amphidinium_carterae.1
MTGLEDSSTPLPLRRDSTYAEEIQKSTVVVVMEPTIWRDILASLRNCNDSGGRILTRAFAE